MKANRKKRWDVTHSLTPHPDISLHHDYKLNIPEIPEVKKVVDYNKNHSISTGIGQRSRKHRLMQERSTQIQKSNRMLYQKIRKIMQKGHSSQQKIQPQPEPASPPKQFLSTLKPLSLPHVRSPSTPFSVSRSPFSSTQSQLIHILEDRPKFAQKYFQELAIARQNMINIHTEEIGDFAAYGWKIKVLKLNHGEFIVLCGKKGKKQVKKKYLYDKVKAKIQINLEEWAKGKFQFEI